MKIKTHNEKASENRNKNKIFFFVLNEVKKGNERNMILNLERTEIDYE